jgi:hypothetical protein
MTMSRLVSEWLWEPLLNRLSLMGALTRYRMLKLAFVYTRDEKVDGDYFEFGTQRGRSLVYAYAHAQALGQSTRFHVFDSFEGFPKPRGADAIFERFQEGGAKCSLGEFVGYLRRHKVDESRVSIVQGWYRDTLNDETRSRIDAGTARIVNIDCDLYESASQALEFVTPHVTSGTVLLCDDYYCYRANPRRGEQRAVRDWLGRHREIELIPWNNYETHGKAFIVSMRCPGEDPQDEGSPGAGPVDAGRTKGRG